MGNDSDREALRADDDNWKLGIFYTSMKDPAPLVPKRYGWGWTANFGSPWTWLLGIVIVAVLIWGVFF